MKFTLSDSIAVASAVRALRSGAIIAYPTEAVFGLGCDPANEDAVMALVRLKARSSSKGLIVIGAALDHVRPYIDWNSISNVLRSQIIASWPGEQTWILPCSPDAHGMLRGSHQGIAVRVTAHRPAAELCIAFGGALVSTSANPSGEPPALSTSDVERYFGSRVDLLLDAPVGNRAQPTPIREALTGRVVRS